jgi:hypothetical protein
MLVKDSHDFNTAVRIICNDNFRILELICDSVFVGDTAATLSRGAVHLLMEISNSTAEGFILRLLQKRFAEYQKRNRDLADIIRDNRYLVLNVVCFQ